mgnify:CR=1 FL=1
MFLCELVRLVEIDSGADGDGFISASGAFGAGGSEVRTVVHRSQVSRPKRQRVTATAAGEVIMATILDGELLAGAVGEPESCNDILFALHLKIVRG